jgi:hypothetical protein
MATVLAAATLVATGLVAGAQAQTVTCADYLRADKQISAVIAKAPPSTSATELNAQTTFDQRVRTYCAGHPDADISKAMGEATR